MRAAGMILDSDLACFIGALPKVEGAAECHWTARFSLMSVGNGASVSCVYFDAESYHLVRSGPSVFAVIC